MNKQSPKQKEIVGRVMHEFKHGELEKRDGEPVENPKQAIAIALHEAGATNQESPQKNKANLRKTARRERQGKTAKARAEGETQRRSKSPAARARNSTPKRSAATSPGDPR